MTYDWYNETSRLFMERGYLRQGETIQDRISAITKLVLYHFNDPEVATKVRKYCEEGYYVLPSPVLSNIGADRGGGISCFNSYFGDSIDEIIGATAEIGKMCKVGGGTSGYFGDVRPRGSSISSGGETLGPIHFMRMPDTFKRVISQNNVRRGEFAAYLPIDHADIKEFLQINSEGNALQRFPIGVCVPTYWINEMRNGDEDKQDIWAELLDTRSRTGFPYIFFTDNVNNGTSQVYKDKGYKIQASNMCTEILLPSNAKESFVCDLIGMNLVKYKEWKDTDAVRIALYIADAVLSDFIERYKDSPFLGRAVRFAERHRAVAIGASGYHSLLQSQMLPFESLAAKALNVQIFKHIHDQGLEASREMARRFGKPDMLKEWRYDTRHTCLFAIAPNTSSSFIFGQQSQSVEPYTSNYYIKKVAKDIYTLKNPYLIEVLKKYDMNTFEVWQSILKKNGSIAHLTALPKEVRDVFKTFGEISQREIILQAAARQKYIDQGQSINLMIDPNLDLADVNTLILEAHDLGIKTLYYQLGQNAAQEFSRDILSCEMCAG